MACNKTIHENLVVKESSNKDLTLLTLCARNSDDAPAQFCSECDFDNNKWETIKHLNLVTVDYKSTETCDEQQIEAGYQYIKKVVLSALDNK